MHSVSCQPGGYRVLTASESGVVGIWNLLPMISPEHEDPADKNDTQIPGNEDITADEESFLDRDVKDLESLFEKEEPLRKKQRLLSFISIDGSINIVKWNPLGTCFIVGSQEGQIIVFDFGGYQNMK